MLWRGKKNVRFVKAEKASFTPAVYHRGYGYMTVAASDDLEERAANQHMPSLLELRYYWKGSRRFPQGRRLTLAGDVILWQRCIGFSTEESETRILDKAFLWAEMANALVKMHNIRAVETVKWYLLMPETWLLRYEVSQMQGGLERACRLLWGFSACLPRIPFRGAYMLKTPAISSRRTTNIIQIARILEEAISFAQLAEDCPSETETQARRLLLSGTLLAMRYHRPQNSNNLRKAIAKLEEAEMKGINDSETGRAKIFVSNARYHLALAAEVGSADFEQFITYEEAMTADSIQSIYDFAEYSFHLCELMREGRCQPPRRLLTMLKNRSRGCCRVRFLVQVQPVTQLLKFWLVGFWRLTTSNTGSNVKSNWKILRFIECGVRKCLRRLSILICLLINSSPEHPFKKKVREHLSDYWKSSQHDLNSQPPAFFFLTTKRTLLNVCVKSV